MSNKKQSSVEWLVEMLDIDTNDSSTKEILQQAKAIHYQESIEFVKTCREAMAADDYSINHWYNKTFGGENG